MKKRIGSYPRVRTEGGGQAVVSQAGSVLLVETVRKSGLDQAISAALTPWRKARAVHDPGKILLDIALAVASGGDCLAVLTHSVVDTADGRVSAECGVAAVVVVGVEEVCQRVGPFPVRGVGLQVGPFVEQGAVEAFDLAVGLRPVGRIFLWAMPAVVSFWVNSLDL